jgi:hypothetical protein
VRFMIFAICHPSFVGFVYSVPGGAPIGPIGFRVDRYAGLLGI